MDFFFADGAGLFTFAAVIGTFVFLLRLGLLLVGGLDHGLDFEADAAAHPDATDIFQIFTVQGVAAFAMGFGWGGLGGLRGADWHWLAAAVVGLVCGVAMGLLQHSLMSGLRSLETSGNIPPDAAIGEVGDVYLTIPAAGTGRGQVRVNVRDHQRIYDAVTEGVELPSRTAIRVVGVNQDRSLTVIAA